MQDFSACLASKNAAFHPFAKPQLRRPRPSECLGHSRSRLLIVTEATVARPHVVGFLFQHSKYLFKHENLLSLLERFMHLRGFGTERSVLPLGLVLAKRS